MFIHELAQASGVSARTIRYYESIGLVPNPQRAENNYRQYAPDALERLRFIVSARSLGFSLTDIGEFLSARDEGTLPCKRVLDSLDGRIADLLALRDTLQRIQSDGEDLVSQKSEKYQGFGCCLCQSHIYLSIENISNCFEIYFETSEKARV